MVFSCILIGDEWLLAECAEVLLLHKHSVCAVVTANQRLRDWAISRKIPVRQWRENLTELVGDLDYDWLFSIANLRMLPEPFWRKARYGAVNFHDGPLPRFAGLNTPSWALMEGAANYGVTWHAITASIDEGGIYASSDFALEADDTALTLNVRCFQAAIESFSEVIGNIEAGRLETTPQALSQRHYYSKNMRPAGAGMIRFDRPGEEILRFVRALDFGSGYANPLVSSKIATSHGVFLVKTIEVMAGDAAAAGSIVSVDERGVVIACADCTLLVEAVRQTPAGETKLSQVLKVGDVLPAWDDGLIAGLDAVVADIAGHENWFRGQLGQAVDIHLTEVRESHPGSEFGSLRFNFPDTIALDDRVALLCAFLLRKSGQEHFSLAYAHTDLSALAAAFPGHFASVVPLYAASQAGMAVGEFRARINEGLTALRKRRTFLADMLHRYPDVSHPHYSVGINETAAEGLSALIEGCALTFAMTPSGENDALIYDRTRLTDEAAAVLVKQLRVVALSFADEDKAVDDLMLMEKDEQQRILVDWNRTETEYDRSVCVHELFERQVTISPDATAVVCGDVSLTYRQLDQKANRLAQALVEHGVGPDAIVGLYVSRSVDMVVGMLGIHKAGGAYLPLDPVFPADRLKLMIEDSATRVIVTDRSHLRALQQPDLTALCIEDITEQNAPIARPVVAVAASNLAYVIYTSGSTGRPKGVMVEHGNVVNFFAGMDERIVWDRSSQPVWLAVTSLSFDISVLELLWTLARGFKVVVFSSEIRSAAANPSSLSRAGKSAQKVDFGLFFWGNDASVSQNKYNLLLKSAVFADENGFDAIWVPERHFHAFGGPYPNPAVAAAALSVITKRLSIRAGSCVLPLNHPARVAEEWAMVDNLSGGRVAIAFASGWMPEDFVLRPENAPPNNKTALLRDIDVVKKLWRGEAVEFDPGTGNTIAISTYPRPVQPELPTWMTTAGNPESYKSAAQAGANVLTHLLGQSIDELADKIRIYRKTLADNGHDPADFKVTVMLHTFLGENRDTVREQAREPMKAYLRSAAALIKQYAWAFPAFKKPAGVSNPIDIDLRSLDEEEFDAILEFAFLRYFEDSGLFGTVADALDRVDELAAIGVDEIACLIDYGISEELVLDGLKPLAGVVARRSGDGEITTDRPVESFASVITRHGVTHFQCTPSMARIVLLDDDDRRALSQVEHMFVGGEALPAALLGELRRATGAGILNMYGPTETTIWSSTAVADTAEGVVPLGKPIANTQLYVLDERQRLVATGQSGELCIGGDGVTRGYLNRPELTDDRFKSNPFASGRYYRTGDRVRFDNDGNLHFLGRVDYQVKIRGYRIELGEIEAAIDAFPGIVEAVVMAREDRADDVRLVAYIRTAGDVLDEDALKAHLRASLPDYMVPSHFVTMEAFPLTPNAKVDRNALPKPASTISQLSQHQEYIAPDGRIQSDIAAIFGEILGTDRVGISDNFFALGGNSLLAVQAHRRLKATVAPELTITDLFRFPTVGGLAAHIENRGEANERLNRVADRASMRRSALSGRRSALAHTDA